MFRSKIKKTSPTPSPVVPTRETTEPRRPFKVQLVGTVAGVEACRLLTEADEIVVGSATTCDLVMLDPLAPRRAFRIVHAKEHVGHGADCHACWRVEPFPGSRIYVNNDLARKEQLHFGDTIAMGCHRFTFLDGDAAERDHTANINVDDLCTSLLDAGKVPTGYLRGLPTWRDKMRNQKAGMVGAALAILLALCFLFRGESPPEFESSAPPKDLEITVLGPRTIIPKGSTSTALSAVKRQTFTAPVADPAPPADLQQPDVQPVADMQGNAITPSAPVENTPPAPADLGRVMQDAGPVVADLPTTGISEMRVAVNHSATRLGSSSTPGRRVAIAEAAVGTAVTAELATYSGSVSKGAMASATSTTYAKEFTRRPQAKPTVSLEGQRTEVLASLQPSGVQLTEYRGQKIPIARIPADLSKLPEGPASGAGGGAAASGVGGGPGSGGTRGISLDGEVTDAEAAVSFKTGRFHIHAAGTPPEASPATYCYVSKTQVDGKDYLYISFVCTDPNLGALIVNHATGTAELCWDDSIEIFLDLNCDRVDYHQIIINARGEYFATYCPNAELGINGKGSPWDSGIKVKTTINRDAGRWVCEALLPYDHLPTVPAKGTKVPVNFCRNFRGQTSKDPNALQNWFSVYEGEGSNYHHPRLFGVLEWP